MPSSIRKIDLIEALRNYHQQQCRGIGGRCSSSNSSEDEAIETSGRHSAATSASEFVSGWDETVADDVGDDGNNSSSDAGLATSLQQRFHNKSRTSITPHAVANVSWVYGIAEAKEGGCVTRNHDGIDNVSSSKQSGSRSQSEWRFRWKTSLAPHRIHQIASNESGTIIAATTDNGTVSIIRGHDGRILATRKVAETTTEDDNITMNSSCSLLEMAPEVSFVTQKASSNKKLDNVRDALLVQTPNQPALLVSNIQGDRLNDDNDAVVTQATKSMNLQVLQIPSIQPADVECMRGYFFSSGSDDDEKNEQNTKDSYCEKIRLVLIHQDFSGEERLALAEYDLGTQLCHLRQKDLSVPDRSSWEIDTFVGLRLTSTVGRFVLALVVHPKTCQTVNHEKNLQQKQLACSKILWLDPDNDLEDMHQQGQLSADPDVSNFVAIKEEYPLVAALKEDGVTHEHSTRYQRSRVQALEFAHAFNSHEAIAMIVAAEEAGGGSSPDIQILQAHVQNNSDGVLQFGRAHMVYRIQMPSTMAPTRSICLCPLDSNVYGPYSFCSKTSLGWNRIEEMHMFETRRMDEYRTDGSAIGVIRLLITKNEFDRARALVHENGMEVLLGDKFAQFHPAEIVLERLRQILSKSLERVAMPSSDEELLDDDWYESLIGLERSAGNTKGQRVLLEAADYLLHWPSNSKLKVSDCGAMTKRLGSYLSSFVKMMTNASEDFFDQDVPTWISTTYNNRVLALEEKMTAITYLNSLRESRKSETNPLSDNTDYSVISSRFTSIGSIDDLFFFFIQNANFSEAERLWGSTLRSKITAAVMVSSILQIPSTIHPRKYANLLDGIVLPSLSINHELIPSILNWACQMADKFDAENEEGLNKSIFLLETIVRATKRLRLKVHSSFAYYSPFVDRTISANKKGRLFSMKERNNNNMSMSGILSLDASFGTESRSLVSHPSDDSLSLNGRAKKKARTSNNNERSNPTILEFGRMKGGAARLGQVHALRVDTIDENEESVETKLETARWLKLARSLGLGRELVSLYNFEDQGGVGYISKELTRHYSSAASSHEERHNGLTNEVQKFCAASHAKYDEALMEYSKELCRGKSTSSQAIEEVASVARCCLNSTAKCQITKIALQAALFCRFSPVWLTDLSKDAIEWSAGDSSLRSELEEASRLLLIDGIVGRYCGNGAKELFHVDNPFHATSLLDFVSKHLDHDSVLSDILDLCEAFHHLSVEDGCGRLIQNTILRGHRDKARSILESLYDRNASSAHSVFSRVISFCIDLIQENSSFLGPFPDGSMSVESSMRLKESKVVTNCAYDLTMIALENAGMIISSHFGSGFTNSQFNESRLQSLFLDLERLIALQQDHNIFVSLADLNDSKVMIGMASKLLNNLGIMYTKGEFNAASTIATKTRRACSLLSRPPQLTESDLLFTAANPVACQLALRTNGFEAFDFLSDLRILEASQCNLAARCCLSVALSYCMKLSKKSSSCLLDTMKGLVMASSLIQDYILSRCSIDILGVAVDFSQLCDIVSQVLARADEGYGEQLDDFRKMLVQRAAEKRWSFALSNNITRSGIGESLRVSQPILHPSWYIGDGLLLPPEEALKKGIEYCKQSMGLQLMDEPSMGIHAFVANRGAHALALRILSHSTTTQLCLPQSDIALSELEDFNQQIGIALLERYLGGTGNGITSGVVDSQLAASFLLSLPLKLAFKIYRSSLPTAVSTRDFSRVVILATIGKVSGSKNSILSPTGAQLGNWTRQSKFVSQCDSLAMKASWWNVLEENNVNFNPHNFEERVEIEHAEDSYVASMIPALIANKMSKKDGDIDCTLSLAIQFAKSFSLPKDLPARRFIQYLLVPSKAYNGQFIKNKVSCLSDTVRRLLHHLTCASERIKILRQCLMLVEGQDDCVDYERLCVIYGLYQTELSTVISKKTNEENELLDNLLIELEAIDRRRDALAILSSYFQGEKKDERPSFSMFFTPLKGSIDDNSNEKFKFKKIRSRVLGWEVEPEPDTFDPLDPLEKILRSTCSSAITSGLSPLCIPLGVPRGYIRVRSLIARFQKSKNEGASLPTFDEDVMPILNQLRAPSDVAELAEWCSNQYGLDSSDKLSCLDYALNFAIKASTEAERGASQQSQGIETHIECDEAKALARVKRITVAKDLLGDRLEITSILQPHPQATKNPCPVSRLLEKLMAKLEEQVWSKSDPFVPERFVTTILTEASLLVANATLCEDESLSVGQFRQLSLLVHRVCNCIAGKYSHVQTGYIARRVTKRWLFHGDKQADEIDEKDKFMIPVIPQSNSLIPDIDEDDTMNFQMDLSILKEGSDWASNFSVGASRSIDDKKKLTSEEEPSSLEASSGREMSEEASHRSSLRIAFVMAFADGYHRSLTDDSNEDGNENWKPEVNRKTKPTKTPRRGLLSRMKKPKAKDKEDQHTSVLEHARDLVRVVFAKSKSGDRVLKGLNASFDSIVVGTNRSNPATITFAMRHRCLRVASILVPQEALEEVLNEDEFAPSSSLKVCSFGSFCAKELEEMGLPIPHSDLSQLSKMHFPSYARALWRHHRDIKRGKGRLLLLILELYLKETISDNSFFISIMHEIETLNLPRTFLLSFECIVRYMDKIGPANTPSFLEVNASELSRFSDRLLQMVYADLKRKIETSNSDSNGTIGSNLGDSTLNTLSRLGHVLGAFSDTSEGQRALLRYCQELLRICHFAPSNDEHQRLRFIIEYSMFQVTDKSVQVDLFGKLSKLLGDGVAGQGKEKATGVEYLSPTLQ
ncbi:unnamed protein product [Pseudo-nitzschia multistriata]|uniref:KNTC1 third ARM-repeats domain-containing protein n=1 Tax=Pseudo-nitzschia multistriata TaxID=183589 RepID=A0A448ZIE3_9STRA|nr:unnamed protein product [Pseudo-nitzschia multistriata]